MYAFYLLLRVHNIDMVLIFLVGFEYFQVGPHGVPEEAEHFRITRVLFPSHSHCVDFSYVELDPFLLSEASDA